MRRLIDADLGGGLRTRASMTLVLQLEEERLPPCQGAGRTHQSGRKARHRGTSERSPWDMKTVWWLDIVRKALGRHEIATVETTSIDNEAGLIRLTTVLARGVGVARPARASPACLRP